MNVVFEDDNTLSCIGMQALLTELFKNIKDEGMQFDRLGLDSVLQANIIVKSFFAGERFLCQPLMKLRPKCCLVIGVYEGNKLPACARLPLCFSNIVFINRTDSIDKIIELVYLGWQRCLLETQEPAKQNCLSCNHQKLTLQQASFATRFFLGEETHAIARKMQVSCKTVSSHKYVIMKKFNVDTDRDLLNLLHLLKRQLISPNLFTDYLNLCR